MSAQDFFHDLVYTPVDVWNSGVADGIGLDVNTLRDYVHLLDSYSMTKITKISSEDIEVVKKSIDRYNDRGVKIEYLTKVIDKSGFKNKNISINGKIVVGISFVDCDLSDTYFANCTFYGCDFNNCKFDNATLSSSCFYNCTMVGNSFKSTMITRVRFVNTTSYSNIFNDTLLNDSGFITMCGDLHFNKSKINGSYFTDLQGSIGFEKTKVVECHLSEVLNLSVLKNVNLFSCTFNKIDASSCKISNLEKSACVFKNFVVDNKNFSLIDKTVEYAPPSFLEYENEYEF
jgi:uncharacterized protein YjbI with pentapeptide repeats